MKIKLKIKIYEDRNTIVGILARNGYAVVVKKETSERGNYIDDYFIIAEIPDKCVVKGDDDE